MNSFQKVALVPCCSYWSRGYNFLWLLLETTLLHSNSLQIDALQSTRILALSSKGLILNLIHTFCLRLSVPYSEQICVIYQFTVP